MYTYSYDEPMNDFNTQRDDREDYDYEMQRQRRLDEATGFSTDDVDIFETED